MNRLQFLLIKLAEENNEVAQMALKTAQFGAHEIRPNQPLTNFQRTHLELDDLMAIIEMLNEECGFAYTPNRKNIEDKKELVNHYARLSEQLGMVNFQQNN